MNWKFIVAVAVAAGSSLASAAEPARAISKTVRKQAADRHADAAPVTIMTRVKDDGSLVDDRYGFWSEASGKQIWVQPKPGGKFDVVVEEQPIAPLKSALPERITPLAQALAEAKKQGLIGGFKGPENDEGLVLASLMNENGRAVWRFHGVDATGTYVSIAIAGPADPAAPPTAEAPLSDERAPATPKDIARVLKERVGQDAAGVSVQVRKPNEYSMELTLKGKVPHPGVKMQIRRAILRWVDVPGNPEYDDTAVAAPGRLQLLGSAFEPNGSDMHTPGRIHLSQNGQRLAVFKSGPPHRIDIWDTSKGRAALSFPAPVSDRKAFTELPFSVLSPDGESGAAVVRAPKVNAVVFFGEAAAVPRLPLDPALIVTGLGISAGGKAVAVGSNSQVYLIQSGAPVELAVEPKIPNVCNWSLEFSPNGEMLAVGETNTETEVVLVWDVASGKLLHRLTHPGLTVTALAWSGDSRLLAVGTHDQDGIVVFEPSKETVQVLAGMPGKVRALSMSPDGSRLASSHGSVGVGLWDVVKGRLINALDRELAGEEIVGLADNGQMLITGIVRASQEVRRWDVRGGGAADNPVPAGGATAIRKVGAKYDQAGDLLLDISYRIAGNAGKECLLVVTFKDANGKSVVAKGRDLRNADGGLTVTAALRPESDPESAYRLLRVPRAELPASAMTAEITLTRNGRSLLEKPYIYPVKKK